MAKLTLTKVPVNPKLSLTKTPVRTTDVVCAAGTVVMTAVSAAVVVAQIAAGQFLP